MPVCAHARVPVCVLFVCVCACVCVRAPLAHTLKAHRTHAGDEAGHGRVVGGLAVAHGGMVGHGGAWWGMVGGRLAVAHGVWGGSGRFGGVRGVQPQQP